MFIKSLLLTTLILTSLFALSGQEIAQKVHDRDEGNNITSNMKMTLIDKGGNKRTRDLKVYTKEKGEDTLKMMFFLTPAGVKDTAFLTYDYEDSSRDDDQWL